jgi:hypothetical protein
VSTDRTSTAAPRPVPELGGEAGAGRGAVSDADRNRYGLLLDSAAERGLLSPAEYEVRLVALADADTEDELRRIVTELPAFAPAGSTAPSTSTASALGPAARVDDPAALDSALWANLTPARARRGSGNPWVALAVLVLVLLVSLVVLAVVASHLAHTHPAAVAHAPAAVVSRLRP